MALNRLMGLGVGLAVTGAVVKSTLYNGTTTVTVLGVEEGQAHVMHWSRGCIPAECCVQ